jgi:NifU-like protein
MFTIKGVVYPENISQSLARLRRNKPNTNANAATTTANFNCGSFVTFSLSIDTETRTVADASFSSNGCGFMIAAADELAHHITRKNLADLHGLSDAELNKHIQTNLGEFPTDRRDCAAACIEALRSAFADHRTRQIDEFQGEKALICTCFGVSEGTIENLIAKDSLQTVEQVTSTCNAGGGCGSCRMLIQEMLDELHVVEAG